MGTYCVFLKPRITVLAFQCSIYLSQATSPNTSHVPKVDMNNELLETQRASDH